MICPSCGHDNIEGLDRCDNCQKPLWGLDVPRPDQTAGIVRSVMEHDLGELGHEEAVLARPGESVGDVARRMVEAQAACALVAEEGAADGELSGVLTARDAIGAAAEGAADRTIGELMKHAPEVLHETDSIAAALGLMTVNRREFVPVLLEGGGYGMVTAAGVLRYIAKEDW